MTRRSPIEQPQFSPVAPKAAGDPGLTVMPLTPIELVHALRPLARHADVPEADVLDLTLEKACSLLREMMEDEERNISAAAIALHRGSDDVAPSAIQAAMRRRIKCRQLITMFVGSNAPGDMMTGEAAAQGYLTGDGMRRALAVSEDALDAAWFTGDATDTLIAAHDGSLSQDIDARVRVAGAWPGEPEEDENDMLGELLDFSAKFDRFLPDPVRVAVIAAENEGGVVESGIFEHDVAQPRQLAVEATQMALYLSALATALNYIADEHETSNGGKAA